MPRDALAAELLRLAKREPKGASAVHEFPDGSGWACRGAALQRRFMYPDELE